MYLNPLHEKPIWKLVLFKANLMKIKKNKVPKILQIKFLFLIRNLTSRRPPQKKQPPEVFYKERCFLKFCNNSHRKTPDLGSLFNCKPDGLQLYYKKTPTQVFFCEHCEIFKSTYFKEHLRTSASA